MQKFLIILFFLLIYPSKVISEKNNYFVSGLLSMDKEKSWMLMTYYCTTHGDSGLVEPIQLTKKEISKTFLKKRKES